MATAQRLETNDVASAQAGDHAAFERLFRAHAPRVHALACWLGHEPDADDITQDVFVLVWRKLRLFDGRSAFPTWLHRVAVNAILSRRRRDREPAMESLPDRELHGTSGAADRVELDDLIARLQPELRHVFVLHDVEGYRHDEIAALLGIPAGTSGSRLHRARQLLRAEFNVADDDALKRSAIVAGQRPLAGDLWPSVAAKIDGVVQEPVPHAPTAWLLPFGVVALLAAGVAGVVLIRSGTSTPPTDSAAVAITPSAPVDYEGVQSLARELGRGSIASLDSAVAAAELAANANPGDLYLQRVVSRGRADRAAIDAHLGAMASVRMDGVTQNITSRDTIIPVAEGLELDLSAASGSLVVRTWDRAELRIRTVGNARDPHEVTFSPTAIQVRLAAESEYEVTIPRDIVSGVNAQGADVTIIGTRGRMHAVVLTGNLTATDVSGPTKLEALKGKVVVRRSTGPLMIVASNQHVLIEDARGPMSVRSVNGDITLARVALDAMDVQTYNGAVRVSGTLRGAGGFAASSFKGDVTLHLDPAIGVSARVATSSGSVHWPAHARFRGDSAKRSGVVVLGDGRVNVALESFSGRITITEKGREQ